MADSEESQTTSCNGVIYRSFASALFAFYSFLTQLNLLH